MVEDALHCPRRAIECRSPPFEKGAALPRPINPRTMAPPASRYAHGIVHSARARRLIVSGQIGVRPDGSVPETLAEQIDCAFDNVFAVIAEAGMTPTDLVRINAYCTLPRSVGIYRSVRDRKLQGHLVAATYIEIAGLADPKYLFEIEAEAVFEEPDLAFLELGEEAAGAGRSDAPATASAQRDNR